jgi:PBP1b-binding outer membrane lipoprotein LpoB
MKLTVELVVSDQLALIKEHNMKSFILVVLGILFIAGCASKPVIVRVKNCQALGSDLYDCEQIPARDIDRNAARR